MDAFPHRTAAGPRGCPSSCSPRASWHTTLITLRTPVLKSPPPSLAWTLTCSGASARPHGGNGCWKFTCQPRQTCPQTPAEFGVISAHLSHAGDDFKCPAGSLGYQAAPVPVPGTVMRGPGPRLYQQELGTDRNHLLFIKQQLSGRRFTSIFLASRTCQEGVVLAHFIEEASGAQRSGSRVGIFHCTCSKPGPAGGLAVKDRALSQWRGFSPWPGNFCRPRVQPKKTQKNKKKKNKKNPEKQN